MVLKFVRRAAVGAFLAAAPFATDAFAQDCSGLYLPQPKTIVTRIDDSFNSLVQRVNEQTLSARTRSYLRRAQRLDEDRKKLESAWSARYGAGCAECGIPITSFPCVSAPRNLLEEPTCGLPGFIEPTCGLPGLGTPFGQCG